MFYLQDFFILASPKPSFLYTSKKSIKQFQPHFARSHLTQAINLYSNYQVLEERKSCENECNCRLKVDQNVFQEQLAYFQKQVLTADDNHSYIMNMGNTPHCKKHFYFT